MIARDEPAVRIEPLGHEDIPALIRLAQTIWRQYYGNIITGEQIEYMLARRYDAAAIGQQIRHASAWWDKLTLGGELVAFAASAPGREAGELKIDQLYVRHDLRGRGFGGALIAHIERRAQTAGCSRLYLQVNRNNSSAIAAYLHRGFRVAEAAKFDIGAGFIMDDYIMTKDLASKRDGV